MVTLWSHCMVLQSIGRHAGMFDVCLFVQKHTKQNKLFVRALEKVRGRESLLGWLSCASRHVDASIDLLIKHSLQILLSTKREGLFSRSRPNLSKNKSESPHGIQNTSQNQDL